MPQRFRKGDKVYCKIRGNSIVSANADDYDAKLSFEIIGKDDSNSKYVILIPKYFSVKNSWNVVEEHLGRLNINSSHLDQKAISIPGDRILRISEAGVDGMECLRCKEFFSMAEPNQLDGSFICYSCRLDPWR